MRSPPPPAIRWERRERGTVRASASADESDSAASSLPGVVVVGSSCSQESHVLADLSPVDSSVSAGDDHRSRSRGPLTLFMCISLARSRFS